jgi:hydrogenase nickel incorporation protein HypA/HybF
MHELAVTESIISIAGKHAQAAHAARVTDIYITIGQLSSIVDDSVQFYWEIIGKDTICEGATLHFNRIPARLQCKSCGKEYGIESELEPCPDCGGYQVSVIAGEEFWLDSIEVVQNEEEISE